MEQVARRGGKSVEEASTQDFGGAGRERKGGRRAPPLAADVITKEAFPPAFSEDGRC